VEKHTVQVSTRSVYSREGASSSFAEWVYARVLKFASAWTLSGKRPREYSPWI